MKILIPIGCRSDEGLILPIIKRLQKDPFFECTLYKLIPSNFIESYKETIDEIRIIKPDLILCVADRIEMCAAACAAFHNNVKIGHVYAGCINYPLSTFDDINRHCISLWSDIQFVESKKAFLNITNLFTSIGKQTNCYTVGISHFDDLEIDESLVPEKPYDLILINPTTLIEDKKITIKQVRKHIVIGQNPDPQIFDNEMIKSPTYDNLPRPKFLGLLKNCERFITNSSAAIYEAPHFLKSEQIIHIGERNKNRDKGPFEIGASDKIVKILKEYFK